MEKTIAEIADVLNGVIEGDSTISISGVTKSSEPQRGMITFIDDEKKLETLEKTDISAIIVPHSIERSEKPLIRVTNPKLAFAKTIALFHPPRMFAQKIAPMARVHPTADIAEGVTIEDFAIVNEGVSIGKGSTIRSFSYIDRDVQIGEQTIIHPNVCIYERTQIGNRVIINSSTAIGADGFGYVKDENGRLVKFPQLGNVVIEDDVEIGSNVSIDCATFGSTLIKRGCKIDNLVQIAHNVMIDENTAISGLSGIAGSTSIGKNCTLAAQVGIADHCVIEDNVILAGQCGVPSKKRIPSGKIFIGAPARPLEAFAKQRGVISRLPALIDDVKEMRKKLEALSSTQKKIPEK